MIIRKLAVDYPRSFDIAYYIFPLQVFLLNFRTLSIVTLFLAFLILSKFRCYLDLSFNSKGFESHFWKTYKQDKIIWNITEEEDHKFENHICFLCNLLK